MLKKKNWQLYLILVVIALTIYNILPTVFYYSKPLKSAITKERAFDIQSKLHKEPIFWKVNL